MNANPNDVIAKLKELQNPTLAKAFTQPGSAISGINTYDLEAGARLLYPVTTLLRNMIPRRTGGQGIQANWRTITAINPSGNPLGLSEGNRGGVMDQTVNDVLAKFAFFGQDNYVTFEAQYSAEGFDDVLALATKTLLEATMEAEEKIILGGNSSISLGTAAQPTCTPSTTGGTLAAGTTYSVIVVPLTYDGMLYSTFPTGTAAAPVGGSVKLPYTRTNADSTTDTINGFSGQKSTASAAVTTTGTTGSITATTTAIQGALGYAWFLGATAGTEKLNQITPGPKVVLQALNATGQLASAGFASDTSTNALNFDGLLTQALKAGSGSYWLDLGGATLTAAGSGLGGITEIDNAIVSFYNNHRLVPTDIFMNGTDQMNAKNKILNGNTNLAPFFMGMAAGGVGGGTQFKKYNNPIGFGNQELNVHAHPFIPQGTIYFYSSKVPYALSNVADIVKMNLRRDYYRIDWPVVTRKRYYGVYFDGVLQNYFNPAFGVLTGVGNG